MSPRAVGKHRLAGSRHRLPNIIQLRHCDPTDGRAMTNDVAGHMDPTEMC